MDKEFRVFVDWQMSRVVTVRATSVKEAIRKVVQRKHPITDASGECLDGSFEVDVDATLEAAAEEAAAEDAARNTDA